MVGHVANRFEHHALRQRFFHVNKEHGQAFAFAFDFGEGCGASEQHHPIGMLHPGDPDLLPLHDIAIVALDGRGFEARGVTARARFGDRHGLQAPFTTGNAGQVALFLFA